MSNPNHDEQGRFSSSNLRGQIVSAMKYSEAKAIKEKLEAQAAEHGRALKALSGGGPMGLTPDSVKSTPEWKKAKADNDRSFAQLQEYNTHFIKAHGKEYKTDIQSRRGQK